MKKLSDLAGRHKRDSQEAVILQAERSAPRCPAPARKETPRAESMNDADDDRQPGDAQQRVDAADETPHLAGRGEVARSCACAGERRVRPASC